LSLTGKLVGHAFDMIHNRLATMIRYLLASACPLWVYSRAERHASSFAFWRPVSAPSLNRDFVDPHVGFWHKADMPVSPSDVRFPG
jgi:hypothetical protein